MHRLGAYDQCMALPRESARWCTWTVPLKVSVGQTAVALSTVPLIEGTCLPPACAGAAFVPALKMGAAQGMQTLTELLIALEDAVPGLSNLTLPTKSPAAPHPLRDAVDGSTLACGGTAGTLDSGASVAVVVLVLLASLVAVATVRDLLPQSERSSSASVAAERVAAAGVDVNTAETSERSAGELPDLGGAGGGDLAQDEEAAMGSGAALTDGAALDEESAADAPRFALTHQEEDDRDSDEAPLLGDAGEVENMAGGDSTPPAPVKLKELTAVTATTGAETAAAASSAQLVSEDMPDTWPRPAPPPPAARTLAARLLVSFSLVRNVPLLLGTGRKPGAIGCFDGIRALSMMWYGIVHAGVGKGGRAGGRRQRRWRK